MVLTGLIPHMEISEIRRRNFWAITHPKGYSDKGVSLIAERTGKTEQRIRHLIAKDPDTKTFKNIGSNAARDFENSLDLDVGWLDHPHPELWFNHNLQESPQSNATFEAGVDSWDTGTPLGEDEIELPFYSEVQLAAGNGFVCDEERITKKLRFSKETLRKSGVDISHAVCVKVEGLSMLPVLPSGSTVGIDSSKKTIHDGDMYAINHKGELRVKLLYNMPGSGVRVRSFNRDEFPDEHYSNIDEAEIHVIGRVFWYSVLC